MKQTSFISILFSTLLLMSIVCLNSCSGEAPVIENDQPKHQPPLKIVSPTNSEQFTIGDPIEVVLEIPDPAKVSKLELFVDDTLYKTDWDGNSVTIETTNSRVGFVKVFVSYVGDDGKTHGDTRTVTIFSDVEPQQLKAVKVSSLNHDKGSYTQGLEFYKGRLYEGTGQYGQSILSEKELKSGLTLRKVDLEKRYFGEGITILNDTIYQITWVEKVCFMYDMNFNKIGEFTYEGEGWGLCNDGKSLIMSNGTSEIVFRNPSTFQIERRIHVFDDDEEIASINELEFINGKLYANVYMEDHILEIDPKTGKILSEIDCSDIVNEGRVPGADVLNGIAYHPETNKIYLTGKWWPLMFEVKFEVLQ